MYSLGFCPLSLITPNLDNLYNFFSDVGERPELAQNGRQGNTPTILFGIWIHFPSHYLRKSRFIYFVESKSESETCRFRTSFDSRQKCIFGTNSEGYICNACEDLQLKPFIGTHILKLVWFFNLQVQKRLYLAKIWLIWPLFRGLYSLLLRGECSRNDECSRNVAGM